MLTLYVHCTPPQRACVRWIYKICLKIWPTVEHSILHMLTAWTLKNCVNMHFGAFGVLLCVLRGRELPDNLTNFPPLNAMQLLCNNPEKCKGAKNAKMFVLVRFTHNCARCTRRIFWKFYQLSTTTNSDLYASTLKNARGSQKSQKEVFGHTLRAQDWLENLTNCPLLIATQSDFYASTLKNARGSQKLQKKAFWRASRAIVQAPVQAAQDRFENLTNCPLLIATVF